MPQNNQSQALNPYRNFLLGNTGNPQVPRFDAGAIGNQNPPPVAPTPVPPIPSFTGAPDFTGGGFNAYPVPPGITGSPGAGTSGGLMTPGPGGVAMDGQKQTPFMPLLGMPPPPMGSDAWRAIIQAKFGGGPPIQGFGG